jgi:dienelactone hydrolase
MMKIVVEDRNVCNIPILDVYELDVNEKRPIIIMLHGANGCKEKYIERAYEFVKRGFFVTLFDAYGHGELKNENEIIDIKKSNIDKLLRVYFETSQYINTIINSYKDCAYADSTRVGLLGVSMGAHTIYYHILKEKNPNVKVAVPINGSPTWKSFVRRYISNSPTEASNFNENDIMRIEKYIESIEPLNYAKNSNDLPLLMLNGEKDELIPINNIRESYSKLQDNYKDQQLVKFVEFEGIGHTVTPQMLEVACEWFKKYL